MIKVTVYHSKSKVINGFKMIGHADSAEYGHDIVCAGVSSLAITTVNSLISIAEIKPTVKKDSVNGGLLIVRIPKISNSQANLKVQTILQSFELGISLIANQYNRYVKLNIIR